MTTDTAPVVTNPDMTIKMIHVRMPGGEVLSIGHDYYTSEYLRAHPDQQVPIRVACSVCSAKDQFIKKRAIANVRAKLAEGRLITATQNTSKASWETTEKVVLAAFTAHGHELTPHSWERKYPDLKLVPNKQIRKVIMKNVVVALTHANTPVGNEEAATALVKRYKESVSSQG